MVIEDSEEPTSRTLLAPSSGRRDEVVSGWEVLRKHLELELKFAKKRLENERQKSSELEKCLDDERRRNTELLQKLDSERKRNTLLSQNLDNERKRNIGLSQNLKRNEETLETAKETVEEISGMLILSTMDEEMQVDEEDAPVRSIQCGDLKTLMRQHLTSTKEKIDEANQKAEMKENEVRDFQKEMSAIFKAGVSGHISNCMENILKNKILKNIEFGMAASKEIPFKQADLSNIFKDQSFGCAFCTWTLLAASASPASQGFTCTDALKILVDVVKHYKKNNSTCYLELPSTEDKVRQWFDPTEAVKRSGDHFMSPFTVTGLVALRSFHSGEKIANLYELNEVIKETVNQDDLFSKNILIMVGCKFAHQQLGHMFAAGRVRSKEDNSWMLCPIDGQREGGECSPVNFLNLSELHIYSITRFGRSVIETHSETVSTL